MCSRLGVLLLATLAFATPVQAQQASSDRLTHLDVFNLEYVGDPQVSPDGSTIVYVRRFADVMTDMTYSNLWVVNTDGTGHRRLTTGDFHDNTPRWSPDGTRLAYISDRGGVQQIYLRWIDTGETSPITDLTEPPMGLEWSPDGGQIAFAKLVPEAALVIGEMPEAPPGAEWAAPAKYTDDMVFRFDGVGEIPPGSAHLFVVPAEGGTARQITEGDQSYGSVFGGASFVWTPDGRSLVVSANLREDAEMEMRDSELYEISVSDGSQVQLTDRRGPDGSPVVSPDGRRIAYVGADDRYQGYQLTKLYVMNRDGSGARSISDHLDRTVGAPQWAPDGSGVYATYTDQGDPKLALFSLNGSHDVVAERLGSGQSAYAGAPGYSLASDGTIAYLTNGPHVPGDVAVMSGGAEARVLTEERRSFCW